MPLALTNGDQQDSETVLLRSHCPQCSPPHMANVGSPAINAQANGGVDGGPTSHSSTLRATYITHGCIPTAKRVCRTLLLAVSVNACFWPHAHGPTRLACTPVGASGTSLYWMYSGRASMRRGHRALQQPVEVLKPRAGYQTKQLVARGRRAGRAKTAVSRANNFFILHSRLAACFTASRSPRHPSHSRTPIPFSFVSPPPLPPARTLSSQLHLDPSALKTGRRSANPLLITPQVSILTTAPTRRLPGRRSQICPQPSAPPRLERGFPGGCTRIL